MIEFARKIRTHTHARIHIYIHTQDNFIDQV